MNDADTTRVVDERHDTSATVERVTPSDRLQQARDTLTDVIDGTKPAREARRPLLLAALCIPIPQREPDDLADLLAAAIARRLGSASRDAVADLRNQARRELERRDKRAAKG